jgi:two-component sensor histidine kinase
VALCELVASIAANVESLLQARLAVSVDVTRRSVTGVCEAEAVPLALVLNELMFNAVKHGVGAAGAVVRVTVGGVGERAELRILNPGRLPERFDFAARNGIGVGLRLVCSLLPPRGASLSIRQAGEDVEALLLIERPIVFETGDSESHEEGNREIATQDPAG